MRAWAQHDRRRLTWRRAGIGDRQCVFDMQFALPAMIEQAIGRVAALLDLGDDQPAANGMDRARRHEDGLAGLDVAPGDQILDRAVDRRGAQVAQVDLLLQAECYPRLIVRSQNIPGFRLAIRQPRRLRSRVTRVDLDGQRSSREDELEQQGRALLAGVATEPDLSDRSIVLVGSGPGREVGTSPGLGDQGSGSEFDRHSCLRFEDDAGLGCAAERNRPSHRRREPWTRSWPMRDADGLDRSEVADGQTIGRERGDSRQRHENGRCQQGGDRRGDTGHRAVVDFEKVAPANKRFGGAGMDLQVEHAMLLAEEGGSTVASLGRRSLGNPIPAISYRTPTNHAWIVQSSRLHS